MVITLRKVKPHHVDESHVKVESIWNNFIEIDCSKKTILNASSGKGKSTFSGILYGLRNDYDGDVLFDDQSISRLELNDWIEIRKNTLSAVFQDLQLFPKLTALENLEIKNNLTKHRSNSVLLEMLNALGLKHKANQACGTMSLGQQQRVAIIRALLQPFKFLILDEPFSHLDEENANKALALINEEADLNGSGYVLTTLGSKHGFQFDEELKL